MLKWKWKLRSSNRGVKKLKAEWNSVKESRSMFPKKTEKIQLAFTDYYAIVFCNKTICKMKHRFIKKKIPMLNTYVIWSFGRADKLIMLHNKSTINLKVVCPSMWGILPKSFHWQLKKQNLCPFSIFRGTTCFCRKMWRFRKICWDYKKKNWL